MSPKTKILLTLTNGRPHHLLVALFERSINGYWEGCVQSLKEWPDDHSRDVYRRDVLQLKQIMRLYAKGDFESVKSLLSNLDTIVRDTFPCTCWAQVFGMKQLSGCGRKRRTYELRDLRKRY